MYIPPASDRLMVLEFVYCERRPYSSATVGSPGTSSASAEIFAIKLCIGIHRLGSTCLKELPVETILIIFSLID